MRILFTTCTVLALLLTTTAVTAKTFTDDLNRRVDINTPPQRIISLVPSVTEILFSLGLEQKIVADTEFCTYPPAAKKLPKVGSYANPGIENILLHKPDLVFAAADINRSALVQRLQALHIPVYVVYPRTVAQVLTTISGIGAITGAEAAANHLITGIQKRLTAVRNRIETLPRPSTLECVMLQPLTVSGPQTFVDDIITIAGGRNVVTAGPSRYPTWSTEALLAADPQTIIVSSYPGQPQPQHFFAKWPQLQAQRNKRVIQIEADWIHRPGPRMVLGIEALARAFHPAEQLHE